jgi:hypothetical protein
MAAAVDCRKDLDARRKNFDLTVEGTERVAGGWTSPARLSAPTYRPTGPRPINQTWSYVAALSAARLLLSMHEDAGGFELAPGAHAALDLDIMSGKQGLVGAEVFAAVTPNNNGKLKGDLAKLATVARWQSRQWQISWTIGSSVHS